MIGFVLKIRFELNNGKKIEFSGSGCQEAIVNFFQDWPYVTVSPKQLATAESVDALIVMLAANVFDGERYIFAEPMSIKSDVAQGDFDAYDFIRLIKDNIASINDIAKITIELREYNELHFLRIYTYDCNTKKYTGIVKGTPEAAYDCYGYEIDQFILSFGDLKECKTKKQDIYRESDSDDVYFDWNGCVVTE